MVTTPASVSGSSLAFLSLPPSSYPCSLISAAFSSGLAHGSFTPHFFPPPSASSPCSADSPGPLCLPLLSPRLCPFLFFSFLPINNLSLLSLPLWATLRLFPGWRILRSWEAPAPWPAGGKPRVLICPGLGAGAARAGTPVLAGRSHTVTGTLPLPGYAAALLP